ncbi:MAG: hypothetical protein P8M72_01310 [Gammaproteobacteria bacterium]|nr:hypothetical protein [Gammaproteobacteria bacterium]
MQILKKLFISLIILLATFSSASFSQELTPPEPISMEGRFTPAFDGETIVKASFTVKADGTVDDLEVAEIFLENRLVRNVLRDAVIEWTFKPATVAGEAVDYYNHDYIIALRINPNAPATENGPGGRGRNAESPSEPNEDAESATPAFDPSAMEPIQLTLTPVVTEAIEEVSVLMVADDHDRALREVRNSLRRDAVTVFDFALLHDMNTNILMGQNDMYAALESAKLATMTAINPREEEYYFLPDQFLEGALRKKMLLSASLRQHALTLATYDELQNRFGIVNDDQLSELVTTSQAALDSPEPLPLLAKIVEDEWSFNPSRRIFTVSNVEGRLNKIFLRCERRTLELDYEENVDWTIPASLGECKLAFKGRDNTTFVVYEFLE